MTITETAAAPIAESALNYALWASFFLQIGCWIQAEFRFFNSNERRGIFGALGVEFE
jgi:hypothetical protein